MFTSWATKKNKVLATVLALGVGVGAASCSSGDDGDNGGDGATRTFVDSLGNSVEIPDKPERIVSVDFNQATYLLALDAPLVGAMDMSTETKEVFREYGNVDEVESVGDSNFNLDMEAVARLDPDVIVLSSHAGVDNGPDKDVKDQLEGIAPLVYLDTGYQEGQVVPKDIVSPYVEFLGRDDIDIDARQREVDGVVDEIKDALGTDPSNIKTSYIDPMPDNTAWFRYPGNVMPMMMALDMAGVDWAYDKDFSSERRSLETVFDIETNFMIFGGSPEELVRSPLLNKIPVVQEGQVIYSVSGRGSNNVTYDHFLKIARDLLDQIKELKHPLRLDIAS